MMLKKILPLFLLLSGTGIGVGTGVFLRPEVTLNEEEGVAPVGENVKENIIGDNKKNIVDPNAETNEYVKLSNQLVVPIIVETKVAALVVLAVSIEVPAGKTDTVLLREPKLRDSFLQVLFDHANMGGFNGNFTAAEALGHLRTALKEVAQRDLGDDIAKDVLIIEIARQDY